MNKKLFTVAIALIVMACLSMPTWAQSDQAQGQGQAQGDHMGKGHHMPTADEELAHMTKELNLSSDQQSKMKPILEDTHKQANSLRQDTSLSREDRMTKMRQIHENSMAQIKQILTPDQQQKLESEMKEHQGMRHKGEGQSPQQ